MYHYSLQFNVLVKKWKCIVEVYKMCQWLFIIFSSFCNGGRLNQIFKIWLFHFNSFDRILIDFFIDMIETAYAIELLRNAQHAAFFYAEQ